MRKTIRKIIFGFGLCSTAILAASPASAFWAQIFYYDNGLYAGAYVYCDNGQPLVFDGYYTSNYVIEYHTGELPC